MARNHHLCDHEPTSTTPPSPTTSPSSFAPCTCPSQLSHCAAGDGTTDPSQLASRPALAEAALGRRGRTYRITADIFHRQRWRKRKAKSSAALTNLAMLYATHSNIYLISTTCNDGTYSLISLDRNYNLFDSIRTRFCLRLPPPFVPCCFARFGPTSLYNLIVL
ncbi:hypothetical protein BJV77DRAFT_1022418 [Russula vinacea]|nr:hypothetical protein BJV77DRAFT_1022418 [Russula vinacea]